MSVLIKVFDSRGNDSEEYEAAKKLKTILSNTISKNVFGEIIILSNITLFGQRIKDIDLIMIGELNQCKLNLKLNKSDGPDSFEDIYIQSFMTVIELKSHSIDSVYRKGNDMFVKYANGDHNVTGQSEAQKYSLKNYLERNLGESPYITNLIWFNNLLEDDLKELTDANQTNCFSSQFTFDKLMQLIVRQRSFFDNNHYFFNSNNTKLGISNLKNSLNLFTSIKSTIGNMTRERVEQITQSRLSNTNTNDVSKLTIYRGKAGAGKTVSLIQTAIYLCDEYDARVLLLTYNSALVSDMRRLFSFAQIPDLMNPSSVHIMTQHSFFYKLLNTTLYKGDLLLIDDFLKSYTGFLNEFLSLIEDDSFKEELKKEMFENYELNWQYVLIDEAQDLSKEEYSIISNIFGKNHIIAADGGNQFIRDVNRIDWSLEKEKNNIKLKECLRQKSNIISFNNYIMKEYFKNNPITKGNKNMVGGKILILTDRNRFFSLFKQEYEKVLNNHNIPYDILCLVPHNLVLKSQDGNYFKYTKEFDLNGIKVWDGTNKKIRSSYSTDPNCIRVLQYESCRGLEGWTVFCLNFDTFIENKLSEYSGEKRNNLISLESKEDQINHYILDWMMIPLTRAIDTLVITIDNKNSDIYRILKKIANEHKDYVMIIE